MPSSEYTAATGGTLKLKGGPGIEKKKKKKKPKPQEPSSAAASPALGATSDTNPNTTSTASPHPESQTKAHSATPGRKLSDSEVDKVGKEIMDKREGSGERVTGIYKTEAERRYEERKRKRLEDRLKREGIKTHKERVEELNKYLSGLSEHHDMPKIGPG